MKIKRFQDVRNWAQDRGLYDFGDVKTQTVKMMEELGEFSSALNKQDKAEMIDALGDMQVVLINLAKLSGVRLEDCLETAYNVIKDRNGNIVAGNFIKMEDKLKPEPGDPDFKAKLLKKLEERENLKQS